MAAYKIRLKKSDLAYFRRLALDSDKEIEAYHIGISLADNSTRIDEWVYPKRYELQTGSGAIWSQEDIDYVYSRAKQLNKEIISTMHSHPNYLSVMSPTDYKECKKVGLKVLGICGTNQKTRKTFPVFWTLNSALPCKMVYTDEE